MERPVEPGPDDVLATVGGSWAIALLFGVITLLFGIAAMFFTEESLKIIAFLFGLNLVVVGVFRFVAAFAPRESAGERALTLFVGILAICLGVLMMRNTIATVKLFAVLLGLFWLIFGIVEFFQAVAHKGTPSRGWRIFMGALSAIAGIVVVSYPGISIGVLTIVIGIWLMILGILEIVAAFQMKKAEDALGA